MNKLAAEKIASEYYELGIKLAQDKIANVIGKGMHAGLSGSIGVSFLPAIMGGTETVARKLAPATYGKVDKLERLSTLTDDVVGITPFKTQDVINQVAKNMGLKPGLTSDAQVAAAIQNTLGKKIDSPKAFLDLLNRDSLRAFREAKPDLFKGVGRIPEKSELMGWYKPKTPGLVDKLRSVAPGERIELAKSLKAEAAKAVDEFGGELSGVEKLINASPAVAAIGGSAAIARGLYKHLNRQAGYR